MDSLAPTQPRDRDRFYPAPSCPRAASRSSTSTSATRRTTQSPGSSTSYLVSSPRPPSSQPSHKHHPVSCPHSTVTSRPSSVLSRDRGSDSGRQSAASSYLQEKLQSKREEAERLAATRSNQDMSTSSELPARHTRSPSVNGSSADGRQPRVSGGNVDPKKRTMGLKEMEAAVSTLHKQNFDLKLELFHRRERQNVLEQRIDDLEAEKTQIDDVNDKLLDELEKRDKAVQEAVQMIVSLEAQVEKLLREREMVRQVDAAGYLPLDELESRLRGPTPKQSKMADLGQREDGTSTLSRMPSFMSDRTENTENLRKVYINSRGSHLNLPRLARETSDEAEGRRINSLASPSLSVLSESSFVSVYGNKEGQGQAVGADTDETPPADGTSLQSRPRKLSQGSDQARPPRPPTVASTRSNRPSRASSVTRAPGPGQFQSIHDIIDHTSPLQKLARLDQAYFDKSPTQDHFPIAGRGQSYKYVKDAKRDTLRRVTTDAPVRSTDQILPPTPDTISTSTLRRFKNSDDTLCRQRDFSGQHNNLAVSGGTFKAGDAEHGGGALVYQQGLVSAFGNSTFDTQPPLISRPRSADESTISHRGGVDWESDADSVHSLDSSLDIWLQQGRDLKQDEQCEGESPDLFGFPSSAGGWNTNAMFGTAGGFQFPTAVHGASNPVDDLMSAQEALFPDAVHPLPPPNRRSSIGAKTGYASRQSVNGKLHKSPSHSGSRRNSVGAQEVHSTASAADAPRTGDTKYGARPKDSHYPPASGATPRGHRLNFFRRSIGGGSSAPPEAASPATETSGPSRMAPMGVPSWVQQSNFMDEDRASATPPPIMRNPRPARSVSVDEGAPVNNHLSTTPTTPMTPRTPLAAPVTFTPANKRVVSAGTTPTSGSAGGNAPENKRKWLPAFSRASSLRNRAG